MCIETRFGRLRIRELAQQRGVREKLEVARGTHKRRRYMA